MRLRLRPEAQLDLEAAARWNEAQEQGLGRLFLEQVRVSIASVATLRLTPWATAAPAEL